MSKTSIKTQIAIVAFALLGITAAFLVMERNLPTVSAAQPGYSLSSFEITYPYDDPRETVAPDPTKAAVSFLSNWTSGYPGNVPCQVELKDATGSSVGELFFELDNATDGARAIPMPVDVSGKPDSATGSCGTSDYRPGPGYVFRGTDMKASSRTDGHIGGTEVSFEVAWEQDVDPGMRTCYLKISRTDGSQDPEHRLDINLAQGPESFFIAGDPESIRTARVNCGPLEP